MRINVLLLVAFLLVLAGCGYPTDAGMVYRTVDPALSFLVPYAEVGLAEPEPLPEPPCIVVKGNINRAGERIYHLPGQANYEQTLIDEEAGERFFCSEEEAKEAGWRAVLR